MPKTNADGSYLCEDGDVGTIDKYEGLLDGPGKVLQDTDGDGKADTALTDAQRSAQKTLAETAIQAYCTPKA